jgi:hypothetical protein
MINVLLAITQSPEVEARTTIILGILGGLLVGLCCAGLSWLMTP